MDRSEEDGPRKISLPRSSQYLVCGRSTGFERVSLPDESVSLPYAVHSNVPIITHRVAIVCELIVFDAEANLGAALVKSVGQT